MFTSEKIAAANANTKYRMFFFNQTFHYKMYLAISVYFSLHFIFILLSFTSQTTLVRIIHAKANSFTRY